MLRNIGAAILAIVVGFLFVGFTIQFNNSLYTMPEELTINDKAGLKEYIESLPTQAFYLVIAGHILGACLAAFIGGKLAASHKFLIGILCLTVLFIATISNFLIIPHPLWVIIIDLLGVLIFGFLCARKAAGGVPDYDF